MTANDPATPGRRRKAGTDVSSIGFGGSADPAGVEPGRRRSLRTVRLLIGVTTLVFIACAAPSRADVVAALGDASIDHDVAARAWVLSAGGARLVIGLDRAADLQILALYSPTGHNWIPSPQADTTVVINGQSESLGRRAGGFDLEDVSIENTGHTLKLHAAFHYRPANLRVVRHLALANGAPVFEVWTTFESLGGMAAISDLNAFELRVPEGPVHWLNGLRGDSMDQEHLDAFALRTQRVGAEGLSLGAQGRSSEETVPWFSIEGAADEFFAGLLWSGAWNLNVTRSADRLSLSMGLVNMTTRLTGTTVEGPHALFGAARGGLPQASAAISAYAVPGLRDGRPFNPLVTFNTWFADGTRIDDEHVRDEMRRAAALGTELFVLDAGWYAGTGAEGVFDFSAGLGQWQPDLDRFPNGLKALTDYAHGLGMKFGLWVEPERADLATVGRTGLDESWLATSGGRQVTDRTGQICLTGAGRAWLFERLTTLIDEVQPDYLKWDNNAWLNCDREGHGHEASDGNFAHVSGLYAMLAGLRERYPALLIENVSGGGNRLDFGMLRYTDVGWMDDRSGPSAYVRHHFEGLSAAFPPAYLFAFVTQSDEERLTQYADLPLYFRSRMLGTLGMSFSLTGLAGSEAMAREIQTYKGLRSTLVEASGTLLTRQAQKDDGPPWDIFQSADPHAAHVILYAFQIDGEVGMVTVRPIDLQPDATYLVEAIDFGPIGSARGDELMLDGIEIFPLHNTNAHILTLSITGAAAE
jgi:alpha-galactosidase